MGITPAAMATRMISPKAGAHLLRQYTGFEFRERCEAVLASPGVADGERIHSSGRPPEIPIANRCSSLGNRN